MSIIIPVLNRVATIEICLESVASQSRPSVEHIFVDGGSTDGTNRVIEAFSQRHLVTWISQPDIGVYDALNKGLALSRGAFLAYLNSNDLYFPWTVETVVEMLSQEPEVVFGDRVDQGWQRRESFAIEFFPQIQSELLHISRHQCPADSVLEAVSD